MPNRANLGVDRILSAYTRLLQNDRTSFVADRALPVSIVNHPRGKYYSVTPGFGYAAPGYGLLRTSGADFRRVTTDVSQTDLYDLDEYGIEAPVDDIDAVFAGSDALDLRQAATEIAWNDAMIQRERDLAALMFDNTTTFASYTAAVGSGDRWNESTADPLVQADTAAESIRSATGHPRSEITLLVGAGCWRYLRSASALTDFYKNVVAGKTHLDEATVASALGIKEIIVGNAVGNSAAEGITASNADLWDEDKALFYVKVDNPRPLAPHGVGATFSMSGRQPGRVERYREEPRKEIVLVSWLEARVVTTPGAGYLYTNVLD